MYYCKQSVYDKVFSIISELLRKKRNLISLFKHRYFIHFLCSDQTQAFAEIFLENHEVPCVTPSLMQGCILLILQ